MYRRYGYVWLGLYATVGLITLVFAIKLKPLSGDLTRIGGYAENDFGWTEPQEIFSPPLARLGAPGTHYEIVVIGDSYSLRTTPDRQTPTGGFWTDFLAADTGVSVGVFDLDKYVLDALIETETAQQSPPRVIILEVAERTLRDHLATARTTSCGCSDPSAVGILLRSCPIKPGLVLPNLSESWSEKRFGQAVDYLNKNVQRWLDFSYEVSELPLSRSDLFSSMRPSELLVYNDDFKKATWTGEDWHAIQCGLCTLQSKVEARGRSRFLLAVAPDKSSAYAAYLPLGVQMPDSFEKIAGAQSLHLPRIDIAIKAAIAAGTRDVYLPNDTHWGSAGSKIAAKSVVEYMNENFKDNVRSSQVN